MACVFLAAPLQAQFQMPDAKEMSGIPRPVDDLPDGTVSVRVIRGQLSNNLVGETVTLAGGGQTVTAKTDETGRAEFKGLAPGTLVKATTEIDGERLASQEFPFPGKGGVRMMLVATDKTAAAKPAVSGQVTIGGQSRIVIEPGDEVVAVYYLLTINNASSGPVDPPEPFAFEMPTDAVGTTVLEGSSPQAIATGTRILVKGPFAPGNTFVQAACELPVTSGTLEIAARFPAPFEQLEVVVKKLGDTKLTSPAITSYHDLTAEGRPYIGGSGRAVPADQEIKLVLSGLPHHSSTPRMLALFLALTIILAGVWASSRPAEAEPTRAAERKRLIARREKLFAELVRLEYDARNGRVDRGKYAARREELVSSLELVYGALEESEPPAPSDDPAGLRRGRSAHVGSEGGATANA
ncbi:MAG: hypothetical protein HY655_08820 [Acidobacteria bacterium]|nr:hypothetical protein [Acidobacteriota bacterium]